MTPRLPGTLSVAARAKVNLFLRVLGRRPDGYHELETLVAPIDFADNLEIHADSGPEFRTLALTLDVTGPLDPMLQVPADESNLVLRAARALANEGDLRGFADITLEKHVPAAAGLGGGSADAAATLRALNQLWECRLGEEALSGVAASVGSDVPALLYGGPVMAKGRGEHVEPVSIRGLELVLVTFPFGISTAEAFGWWDQDGGPTGPDPQPALAAASLSHPEALGDLLHNDLEDAVLRRIPEVKEAKRRLLAAGAAGVVMSGSGPTLVALLPSDGRFDPPDGLEMRMVKTVPGSGGS
jgi:4-diphosphocytidyl-2-C-methyl-D-erythritol kinase